MFQLLDHHPTALELNKYFWCNIQIEDEREKVSGTSLFYKTLKNNNYFDEIFETTKEENYDLFNFVEKVKRYDTWLWITKYNDIEAKQLNDLLYIYGRERFINSMYNKLYDNFWYENKSFFNDTDKLLLELEQDKINNYIDKKSKELVRETLLVNNIVYSVGITFAEQYISQLGNELSKANEDLDFIAIISNNKTVSYRTVKTNIDLGKDIASIFGGGGHKLSAGSSITKEIRNDIIKLIFRGEK